MNSEAIGAARRASKVTIDEAAGFCGLSRVTYIQREQHQDQFRIGELVGLHKHLSDIGKRILIDGVNDFFCENDSV